MSDGKQILALPHVGIPVAGGPGHWCTNHPLGKRLRYTAYGQSIELRRVHENVVHWPNNHESMKDFFFCLIIEQMLTVEMCAITEDYYNCFIPMLFLRLK